MSSDDKEKIEEMQRKYDAYRKVVYKQRSLNNDGQRITDELNEQGISLESDLEKMEGLGDLVHAALNKLGITEERFKEILGIKECNCSKRRRLLNKLVPFFKS